MDLPFVTVITDDEIAQAVCDYAMRRQIGLDPQEHNATYRVTYRNVRQPDGSVRLFASLAVTAVEPKASAPERTT